MIGYNAAGDAFENHPSSGSLSIHNEVSCRDGAATEDFRNEVYRISFDNITFPDPPPTIEPRTFSVGKAVVMYYALCWVGLSVLWNYLTRDLSNLLFYQVDYLHHRQNPYTCISVRGIWHKSGILPGMAISFVEVAGRIELIVW